MSTINQLSSYRKDLPWTLDLDFNGDIKILEDVDAINQSIYTILVSNFGDKPLEEFFGANVAPLTFETASPAAFLEYEIESRLRSAIAKDEPSITILNINIDSTDISHNTIRITISYLLNNRITSGLFDENLSVSNK